MNKSDLDAGTIAALMIRFREYRLPRAKRLLEKVNGGEQLSDQDISFLKRVYQDGLQTQAVVKRHPEYHGIVTRIMGLYTEIISKGLDNEKRSRPEKDGTPSADHH